MVAGRVGWRVEGRAAMYAATAGGWSAVLRLVRIEGRTREQWHVAVRDPLRRAVSTSFMSTVAEAVRLAGGKVGARQR